MKPSERCAQFLSDAGIEHTCEAKWQLSLAELIARETKCDEMVELLKRAVSTCACHLTMRPDIPCLSCAARALIKQANR